MAGKAYCCTDLHGMYSLWAQIRDYCNQDDRIYFLGDAADRGPHGIKIMQEMLLDKRVIYLKGNHEDMFKIVAPTLQLPKEERDFLFAKDIEWWTMNGGKPTMADFIELSKKEQNWLLDKIENLPTSVVYINKKEKRIFLSHAGTNPFYSFSSLKLFGDLDPLLWDRRHFFYPLPEDYNSIIIHGHTPCQYLRKFLLSKGILFSIEKEAGFIRYDKNRKIDLDVASFESNIVILFDLDTLEAARIFMATE